MRKSPTAIKGETNLMQILTFKVSSSEKNTTKRETSHIAVTKELI